jgi:GntR family transcriptional regulator
MTLKRMDNVLLADRVREAILDAILRKEFSERLPSEDELAGILNVSRTTIRTALQSLEQEGVVTRRRAIGTTVNAHVRPSALGLQRLVGFDRLLEEKGYRVRVETTWERTKPPADMVEVFGLPKGDEALITEKRYYADDALAIFIRDAVPLSHLKDPDALGESIPASMFDFSREYFRRPVDHAVVEILAVVKRKANTQLELHGGEAFTRLHERHYAQGGEMQAMSIVDVDDSFVRFEVVRRQ